MLDISPSNLSILQSDFGHSEQVKIGDFVAFLQQRPQSDMNNKMFYRVLTYSGLTRFDLFKHVTIFFRLSPLGDRRYAVFVIKQYLPTVVCALQMLFFSFKYIYNNLNSH